MRSNLVRDATHFLDAEFMRAADRWIASSSPEDAEELIGLALLSDRLDDPRAERAAVSLIEQDFYDDARLSFVRRVLARGTGDDKNLPFEEAQIRVEIATRKRLLELNPRDALRLAESALLYASIGQVSPARSLLKKALILRPDDRYVLRASTRFFMHMGKPDEAQNILMKSPLTLSDPWLRSALFAVQAAFGCDPTGWRKAKFILGDANFSSRDLSELAVQMGSMEYDAGSRKQAIRMLRQGSLSPTENAIAQIGWVARHKTDFKNAEVTVDVSLSHEASAYMAYENSDWENAIFECSAWRKVEPFSVRPAILATFIGCVSMEALEGAAMIGAYGLLANPKNKTLLNNQAAVKALQGKFDDARQLISRAHAAQGDSEDEIILLATDGLIDFREGHHSSGVERYLAAIDNAIDAKNHSLAFRAVCYFTREIARLDSEQGASLLSKIDDTIKQATQRGLTVPKDIGVMREQIAMSVKIANLKTLALASVQSLKWDDFIGDAN
ncbi:MULTISPECIES: tetratricopeptide repeat protein [Rhizobium]|uniref:Tetratricopeptide repeat protein n=1 Tax=Rhizobium rhododendri TaxID=2506430 RepID=A0ABY8IJW7_9HYPH|nr:MULTISPECIES: hypothetical protein [Rhizobium]MBZ5761414.1 hypothetical protein [Rhizobium sp. VS19-DR96]MBZ5767362.1 hypothetical protein [Rhizobium sp. VS19-DR129.2]MBZ5775189.1 hypothetical protein [Rhizobium sp. VS19-DRK62.2]MBZ5785846.1 hypothetical protein [Rhizobium sp. VS19-DR121]MBZ5803272.1 hypothetical protein [Rhizobium sp. VS19-DR181]